MATNLVYPYARELSMKVGPGIVSGDLVRLGWINAVVQADDGVISGRKTGNNPGYASLLLNGTVIKTQVTVPAGGKVAGSPVYAVFSDIKVTALTCVPDEDLAVFGFLKEPQAQGTPTCEVILGPPSDVVPAEEEE
jgi:hypothetical protein